MTNVGKARATLGPGDVAIAGAASGVVTRAVCQPLDVFKIRMQLQTEVKGGKYRGLAHLAITLPREEGLAALWKGHIPAQALSITYGFASFAAFEAVVPMLGEGDKSDSWRLLTHFVAGGLAGCAGTLASAPCDVVRTRLVAQAEPVYRSIWHAVTQLWGEGGVAAFYKGALPAMMMTAPQAALQFGFYSLFTSLVSKVPFNSGSSASISIPESLSCGGLAGMASKSLLYPLDVAKKRLQVSGWGTGRVGLGETVKYTGLRQCVASLIAQEGLRGLYKGFSPALIKAAATTSIHFAAYEHICLLLSLRNPT